MRECICGLPACYDGLRFSKASGAKAASTKRLESPKKAGPINEKDFRRRIAFLSKVPIFKHMPRAQYPLIARVLRTQVWKKGDVIVERGKAYTEFNLIAAGQADVYVQIGNHSSKETLVSGDYFGEKLLRQSGECRLSNVRIVAGEGLVTLSMQPSEFDQLGLRKHMCFPARLVIAHPHKVSGETVDKSARERAFIADALRRNENLRSLADLSEGVIEKMTDAAIREEIAMGTEVVRQGQYGGMFYIVESGSFELRVDNDKEAHEGHHQKSTSGEKLASEMRRRIHRKEIFLQELAHGKDRCFPDPVDGSMATRELSKRLPGSFQRCISADAVRAVTSTQPQDVSLNTQGIRYGLFSPTGDVTSPNFSSFAGSSGGKRISDKAHSVSSRSTLEGPDSCITTPSSSPEHRSRGLPCRVLGVRAWGDSFGELALLYHAPRTSTAVACEDSVVWQVSQSAFRYTVLGNQEERIGDITRHLREVASLQHLLSTEREELARYIVAQNFKPGDWIVHEGDRQHVWFILVQGECVVCTHRDGDHKELARLRPRQHFGERAILREEPSEFSVKACSDVVCLALDAPTFQQLAHSLHADEAFRRAMQDDLEDFAVYMGARNNPKLGLLGHQKSQRTALRTRHQEVLLQLDPSVHTRSLQRLGVLGAGAFGVVSMEKDPTTGELFALKTLSKGHIVQNDLTHDVANEREVLTMIDSPFCSKLYATHKDRNYIYFLLKPLLGGDLRTRLRCEPTFSSPKAYQFVIGCATLALEHLHARHIVYRDLKPENLLFDTDGYCKLCDYGFAKFVLGRTMTICGTPEYMAPEAIRHKGYNRMVDWWALGILTFELIVGETPFVDEDEEADCEVIFSNILLGIDEIEIPFKSSRAVSFVSKLLRPNPAQRLGIGGAHRVKEHCFFTDLDWERLEAQTLDAPYATTSLDPESMEMSEGDLKRLPPTVAYEDDGSKWDADF